jgi:uncharacterized damage-inducible protein DinB
MKDFLIGQYKFVEAITKVNLAGVDHDSSLAQPEGTGNCIYWLVGHITYAYNGMLPSLRQEPVWDGKQGEAFARKGPRLDAATVTVPFDKLVQDLNTACERFAAGVAELGEDRYGEKAPFSPMNNPDETILSLLFLMGTHQAYHCGQIASQRHAAGLTGAIA